MAEAHAPGGPAPDPSMEDILASIRRILDEEGKPTEAAPAPAAPTTTAPEPAPHVAAAPEPEDHDVLDLEPSMMLPDPDDTTPGPVPAPPPILAEPVIATPAAVEPWTPPIPSPPPTHPLTTNASALVAPAAAAAASASMGALMRTLATERSTAVHRGGPTIEDLVREEIRPLAKEWLDTHLPALVERLVRAEIERVVSRMT